jgi:hypothetical protein
VPPPGRSMVTGPAVVLIAGLEEKAHAEADHLIAPLSLSLPLTLPRRRSIPTWVRVA